MTTTLSCGEALVDLLADYAFDTVFGIPGTHAVELYRGLQDGKMRHILARHEQGAGFMADGYARISGKPGLCFLITGPGLTNASTAIAQAYSDSVPMLVVNSVNESWSLGKNWGRLHETTDQRALSRPITAAGGTALNPTDIPKLIADAIEMFQSERPRPAHVEIPLDVFAQTVSDGWRAGAPVAPATADREELDKAAACLRMAEFPAIILGGGAKRAGKDVLRLSEALSAPMVTTIAAKGAVPHSHPLNLGSTLSVCQTQNLLKECDAVLVLGSDLAQTDIWNDDFAFKGTVIRADIDPRELEDNYGADIALHGDAGQVAAYLADALSDHSSGALKFEVTARVASCLQEQMGSLTVKQSAHMAFLKHLRDTLPANTIVAGDMAQVVYTANRYLPFDHPGCFLQPTGYGTLGYALPAALGARVADPDRPVVAIAGDYGAMFTIQEMATAVQENLPIVYVIWNNAALGQIRDDMTGANVRPVGVEATPPDFVTLAKSFGWTAKRVDHASEVPDALRDALNAGCPALIEIPETVYFEALSDTGRTGA